MIGMNPIDATNRRLFPRSMLLQTGHQPSDNQLFEGLLPRSTVAALSKPRQPKSATRTGEEWERQKPNIIRLFVEQDLPLQDVMRKMGEDHDFHAS